MGDGDPVSATLLDVNFNCIRCTLGLRIRRNPAEKDHNFGKDDDTGGSTTYT